MSLNCNPSFNQHDTATTTTTIAPIAAAAVATQDRDRGTKNKTPYNAHTDNDTDIYNVHIIHVSVPLVCRLYNIALYHAVCWCVFSIGKGGGGGVVCKQQKHL